VNTRAYSPVSAFVILMIGLTPGCRRAAPPRRQPVQAIATGSAISMATTSPSLDASSPRSERVPDAAASTDERGMHCKALGGRGFVSLTTIREPVLELAASDSAVYVLSSQAQLRRVTLTRVPRDGSPSSIVARHLGPSEPKSLKIARDAAYFTRSRNIFRVNLADGEIKEIAPSLAEVITVFGEYIFAVRCEKKAPVDYLVRVSTKGGTPESIAELPRVPADQRASGSPACEIGYLAADAHSVFISDWAGRRVLAVSLQDRSARVLSHAKSFPSRIELETDTIVFQAQTGLFRVPRVGGGEVRLSEFANAPFARYVSDTNDFWIDQVEPYAPNEHLYRMPRPGGKAKSLEVFPPTDPQALYPITFIDGLALDDECVYVARHYETFATILARQKN